MATISTGFTIPLAELDRDALPIAGGKGANLGAMLRAGLPVPPGFCVTADTYRTVVAGAAPAISRQLSRLDVDDNQALETASQAIRSEIERLHIPDEVAEAIRAAYAALPSGQGQEPAVAVRSSATAEDLPDASFAGQQETLLNVRGADAVLDAVRRCWSSLWTPRAIAYRTHNGFEHDAVALAVVVQSMIDSEVSGVLFTADPVTGNRTHTVVNASWGLGEAIVSGLVSPDGWVLDQDGQILAEEIAKKERMIVYDQRGGTEERSVPIELQQSACLDASDLARLAALGRAAQEYFGAPQDIEWASRDRQHYLLQSRPITTLFPLPEPRPVDDDLHVYLSGNALQGVMEPITPMGRSIFREMAAVFQSVTGAQIVPRGKPGLLVEAAGRLYIDATPALRNPIGRPLIQLPFKMVDPTTARAFPTLLKDPQLALRPLNRLKAARVIFSLVWKGRSMLRRFARALVTPEATRQQAHATVMRRIRKLEQVSARPMTLGERVLMVRVLLRAGGPTIVAHLGPVFAPGMVASVLTERLVRRWGLDTTKVLALRQGLPGNPTTEMDLALWHLSQQIKSDPATRRLFTEETPEAVAMAYRQAQLPAQVQAGLHEFLDRYGHRAIREIDVGVPRWSERPAYIVNTIRNYLLLDDPAQAPDLHFEALVRDAERAQTELIQAARSQRGGFLKGAILRFLTSRMRSLMGGREAPKFWAIRTFSLMRHVLYGAGEALAAQGVIERPDDVFFLKIEELEQAAQGSPSDLAERVAQCRAAYNRELQRQQLPRIITSEGEIIVGRPASSNPNEIMGVGVSPGAREGDVRVIRDPHGAHLAPGEILVAPSTDPAWTPLFLTAGGLVMEAGGTLSHGSVVAREYGIPAVVGVADATTRLKTGDRIRIDGTLGTVEILDRAPAKSQAITAADVE